MCGCVQELCCVIQNCSHFTWRFSPMGHLWSHLCDTGPPPINFCLRRPRLTLFQSLPTPEQVAPAINCVPLSASLLLIPGSSCRDVSSLLIWMNILWALGDIHSAASSAFCCLSGAHRELGHTAGSCITLQLCWHPAVPPSHPAVPCWHPAVLLCSCPPSSRGALMGKGESAVLQHIPPHGNV